MYSVRFGDDFVFEIFNNTDKEIKEIKLLNEYMKFATKKLDIEKGIFNIIFVSNEEIHNINKEYRNTDRVTDVISFALEDNPDIVYEDFRLLGDIYIAIDVAYDQAIEYNHSREREVCFLAQLIKLLQSLMSSSIIKSFIGLDSIPFSPFSFLL